MGLKTYFEIIFFASELFCDVFSISDFQVKFSEHFTVSQVTAGTN